MSNINTMEVFMFDRKAYMKEYLKKYAQDNKDKIKIRTKKWHENNPTKSSEYSRESRKKHACKKSENDKKNRQCPTKGDYIRKRDKNYREATVRSFLSHKLSQLKKGKHHGKLDDKYKNEINLEFLVSLWETQGGKCALTGKYMIHRKNSLFSCSIDRIDSSFGYVIGNVQLVCQAINFAKNKYSNDEMKYFLNFDKQKEEE